MSNSTHSHLRTSAAVAAHSARPRRWSLLIMLLLVLGASGCGFRRNAAPPPPTATPSPTPAPTATATPAPEQISAAGVVATPQVTIPADFTPIRDERLAYSLAVPKGWSELDLRSKQVQTIAGFFGMGDQLAPLNEFLDSPEGQMIGKIYVTDLASAMFGGLPSVLNVSVLAAPGLSAEAAAGMVQDLIEQNIGTVGSDVVVSDIHATVINNLPAVEGRATAALTGLGRDDQVYGQVVALLANDKAYVLTLLLPADQQAAKADAITQIIGTFRPE